MKIATLCACLVLACAVVHANDYLVGNTDLIYPLFGISTITGNFTLTSGGVGLGGTDNGTCQPPVTATITVPWNFSASASVSEASFVYQISSNKQPAAFPFKIYLDGVAMEGTNYTTGKACSKVTNTSLYSKYSFAYTEDVKAIAQIALQGAPAGATSLTFTVYFDPGCEAGVYFDTDYTAANGASVVILVMDKAGLPEAQVQARAGAFSYDPRFSTGEGVYGIFTALFTIPTVTETEPGRSATGRLSLLTIVGEGEDFKLAELGEGYYLNGKNMTEAFNGADGARWDDLTFNIGDFVGPEETTVNFTIISPKDCLIFIVIALDVETNGLFGVVSQDPHMKTFDGVHATMRLEGDFILTESPATGLAVHGRFCKASRGPWAPWTCAMAIRCAHGEGFVEMNSEPFHATVVGESSALVTKVSHRKYAVSCNNGLTVSMLHFRFHRQSSMDAKINLPKGHVMKVQGLLGNANGNKFDEFAHRNGHMWVPESTAEHYIGHAEAEINHFQESWRVQPHERLFRAEFVPSYTTKSSAASVRGADAQRISKHAAQKACVAAGVRDKVNLAICVHDAVLTSSYAGIPNLVESIAFMK